MVTIHVKDVGYRYQSKYQTVTALKNVTCSFSSGNFYAIIGPSGSGKTTFLSLLAGLDLPSEGEILVDGIATSLIDRDKYRRTIASVVYQSFNLFPHLTAVENVMFPMLINGHGKKKAREEAEEFILKVGLDHQIFKRKPLMMSNGQQQRIAIARALAAGGRILLADEPTGNLDSENECAVVELFRELAHTQDYLCIVITHNVADVAREADITYEIKDGRLLTA